MTVAEEIRAQLIRDKKRYWASDNISEYVTEEKLQALVEEATQAYEKFLERSGRNLEKWRAEPFL